ncbi:hypothetical protein BV25DRAFT_1843195 [Artomyces pyxidatus]|uniref:Uncharacterized protein n=1 Tax=Artomyces pyxidatus TaxID=48021 RepID=A0ACB8SGC5_9AGAM|nr:hypothetical protein BV25DRAFT_1843195 [Artomyces pyxidatus]
MAVGTKWNRQRREIQRRVEGESEGGAARRRPMAPDSDAGNHVAAGGSGRARRDRGRNEVKLLAEDNTSGGEDGESESGRRDDARWRPIRMLRATWRRDEAPAQCPTMK